MNRCLYFYPYPFNQARFTVVLLLAAAALLTGLSAHAQNDSAFKPVVRNFPPAALRGELQVQQPPIIAIDGKPDRLSPGVRIRDTNNMLVMSAALVNRPVVVNYLRESGGMVHEVWILNSEEVLLKRPNSPKSLLERIFGSSNPSVMPSN